MARKYREESKPHFFGYLPPPGGIGISYLNKRGKQQEGKTKVFSSSCSELNKFFLGF